MNSCKNIFKSFLLKHPFVNRLRENAKINRLCIYIVVYVIVVFTFAALYYWRFQKNTTSFLISEQLNKYVDRYDFLDMDIDLATYHWNAKDKMPISIDGFSTMIKPVFDMLQDANDSLSLKEKMLSVCVEKWESLSMIASEMRDDSIEQVRAKILFGYQEKIDSLKREMEGRDTTEMIIAGKFVEMAQLQYEYAKKNAVVQSLYLEYIGNFIPDSLSYQIRERNEDYLELTSIIGDLERTRKDVTSLIRDMTRVFHENRKDAVNYLDFVYYSTCISTTVSFGDIAPNDGFTRLFAIIELLICICIVGAIVDCIIKKNGRGDAPQSS